MLSLDHLQIGCFFSNAFLKVLQSATDQSLYLQTMLSWNPTERDGTGYFKLMTLQRTDLVVGLCWHCLDNFQSITEGWVRISRTLWLRSRSIHKIANLRCNRTRINYLGQMNSRGMIICLEYHWCYFNAVIYGYERKPFPLRISVPCNNLVYFAFTKWNTLLS